MTKTERRQIEYSVHELKAHIEFTTDLVHRRKVENAVERLERILKAKVKTDGTRTGKTGKDEVPSIP